MADDCRISTALPRHPKTVKLIRRLQERAAWFFVCLLLWVADNRPDGDLAGLTGEDLEIAANWNGEPGAFISALVAVRFLDGEPGAYTVHDWAEHNPYVASRPQRIEASRQAGKARWEGVSPEARSEAARQAINARWEHSRQAGDTSDIRAGRTNDTSGVRAAYEPPPLSSRLSPPDTTEKTNPLSELCSSDQVNVPAHEKGGKKRATRIPEDFRVTEAHRQFAIENDLPSPDSQLGAFVDYWRGVPGSRGLKLDWDATFRNWLRKIKQDGRNHYGNRAQQRQAHNLAARAEVIRSFDLDN